MLEKPCSICEYGGTSFCGRSGRLIDTERNSIIGRVFYCGANGRHFKARIPKGLCLYDNPITGQRELWVKGEVVASIPREECGNIFLEWPFNLEVGWSPWRVRGDRAALASRSTRS